MNEQNYLDILINDHALIERALLMLEKQAEKKDKLKPNIAITLVDFLFEYGDTCHNMKEENILFPLIITKGYAASGPNRVMLEEHKGERKIWNSESMLVDMKEKGTLDSNFFPLLEEYLHLPKGICGKKMISFIRWQEIHHN